MLGNRTPDTGNDVLLPLKFQIGIRQALLVYHHLNHIHVITVIVRHGAFKELNLDLFTQPQK
ncbi:hypothetical protein BMETH_2398_0 [methanotrophic bacterial endosymbiont of Bathymodiolus sp.]|nr:hypothetical protein BMETH_2398_0 [methanotrophic bacterial endosymbiont of Bathymodiolus sp.]